MSASPAAASSSRELIKGALDVLFEDVYSEDAKRWFSQPFCFHGNILVQNRGGPCGVLAAMQAHVIMHQTFVHPGCTPQEALQYSVFEVLQRATSDETGKVCIPCRRKTGGRENLAFDPSEVDELDLVTVSSITDPVFAGNEMFQPNSPAGVLLFVLALLLTKGTRAILYEMDDSDAKLTGRFGHCGQEVVNLLLTGRASSQLHDYEILHESGLKLRGIYSRPRIGLLTQLETYRLVQVGSFLKNPEFPIWVVASESHFTVVYSEDAQCDAKTHAELVLENAKRVFHTKDVQDNGFVQHKELREICSELFATSNLAQVDEFIQAKFARGGEGGGGEICLWTDFWREVGPLLREGKSLESALAVGSKWSCAQCTFANSNKAKRCEMCDSLPPPSSEAVAPPTSEGSGGDWSCPSCSMMNLPVLEHCMMCGTPRQPESAALLAGGEERQNKTFTLYHVNGLQRTVQGKVILPERSSPIRVTTVDAALAYNNASTQAFEEVLQTKWPGAIVEYANGASPPSIVG